MSQAALPDTTTTSRRLFLRSGSAVAVFGALATAAAGEVEPEIFRLGRELEKAHIADCSYPLSDPFGPAYDADADEVNYRLHWSLRERIEDLPARSIKELKIKARAAEFALSKDTDATNIGAGSFVNLSQSIMRDLMALAA